MKTMITLLFSALCVATVSAQTDEKDNAMLNNEFSGYSLRSTYVGSY